MKAISQSKPRGLKCVTAVLVISLLATVTCNCAAAEKDPAKERIMRQTAEYWINIGEEQLRRSFYQAAEKSFAKAAENHKYLSTTQQKKLEDLLKKARVGAAEREKILQALQTGRELLKQKEYFKAKAYFEQVKTSPFVTKAELAGLAPELQQVDKYLKEQQQRLSKLYKESVKLYKAGQLQDAQKGFEQVLASPMAVKAVDAKAAEDYLKKIQAEIKLARAAEEAARAAQEAAAPEKTPLPEPERRATIDELEELEVTIEPEPEVPVAVQAEPADETIEQKGGFIQEINRRRRVQQSYTKAVVDDAGAKALEYMASERFAKAEEVLADALRLVKRNRILLGDELLAYYSNVLTELMDKVAAEEIRVEQAKQTRAQAQAERLQAEFRQRQAADRRQRIEDLMKNAVSFQKKQRYEDALGALELLLALDPLNDQALAMKQMLEDTINWRKQLELQREIDRGELDVLLETDRSTIPSEGLSYPPNWPEIAKRRKAEEDAGLDRETANTYRQLQQIVDLSALSPETTFADAIDILRNSTEPALNIVPLWKDLSENALIEPETEINMQGVPRIPAEQGLELLLQAVSAGGLVELTYVVDRGVVRIATKDSPVLVGRLVQVVYDVTQLLGRSAEFMMPPVVGYGGVGGGVGGRGVGGGGGGRGIGGGRGGGGIGGGGGGFGGGGIGRGGGGFGGGGGIGRGGGGGMGGGMGGMGRGGAMGGAGGMYGMDLTGTWQRYQRMDEIIQLIRNIEPETWSFDIEVPEEGRGFVMVFGESKLVVTQTPEIHKKIAKLLKDLGKSAGDQVSIESRFLLVSENFLEEIGLDLNFTVRNLGGKFTDLVVTQGSKGTSASADTGIPSTLAGLTTPSLAAVGGYGTLLDDLQVSFLVEATEAHTNSNVLTAPTVTVLSGQSAAIRREVEQTYVADWEFETQSIGGEGVLQTVIANPIPDLLVSGVVLNVTPIISPDKKYVMLRIIATLRDTPILRTLPISVAGEAPGEQVIQEIELPEQQTTDIQTLVNVPDGGTLLIGGQKLMADVERESGVPVLSHLPFIGRLFSNRSKVKDQQILLILVKPTIILQEEAEADAVATLEEAY